MPFPLATGACFSNASAAITSSFFELIFTIRYASLVMVNVSRLAFAAAGDVPFFRTDTIRRYGIAGQNRYRQFRLSRR